MGLDAPQPAPAAKKDSTPASAAAVEPNGKPLEQPVRHKSAPKAAKPAKPRVAKKSATKATSTAGTKAAAKSARPARPAKVAPAAAAGKGVSRVA